MESLDLPALNRGVQKIAVRVTWEGARWVRLIGLGNLVGIIAILLSIPLLIMGSHMRNLQYHATHQLADIQRRNAVRPLSTNPAPESDLAAFYSQLPAFDTFPETLQTLHDIASKQDVRLLRGEYKAKVDSNAEFARYEVVFPVRASFGSINAFVSESMATLPTLALVSVVFRRERGDGGELDAVVHFALVLRKPSLEEAH